MSENTIVIETKLGQLRGLSKQTTLSKKPYFAFLGIPFAKPPIGDLRFKAPQPFGGWTGVREAVADANSPKQAVLIPLPNADPSKVTDGDEDCLYLNVFVQELAVKEGVKKPVMVSIHGGGFAGGTGASTMAGPDYLVEEDIVLVTFSYRCGAFGFLSLENDEVPGNAGLKDQTLALQWVKDNIDSFGGDPNNVTIFGISAGGASVHYHLLSPLSAGLFHKAIIQSGYATNSWAYQKSPRANAFKLAHAMGCNSINPSLVFKFLQSASSDDIVIATKKISTNHSEVMENVTFVFTPCVELSGTNAFLPKTPKTLLETGQYNHVPVILGNSLNEGSVVMFVDGINDKIISSLNANHELLVPSFLGLKPDTEEKEQAAKAIWQYYLKGEPLTWENAKGFLKYQSDLLFNLGLVEARASLLKSSAEPVYTYLFSNHSRCLCGFLTKVVPHSEKLAKLFDEETCHGADCTFLYTSIMFPPAPMSADHIKAIKQHTKTWANFALTGNPNSKELGAVWERDSENNPTFMDIGESWKANKGVPFLDRFEFWDQLISKYKPSSQSK